MGWEQFSRGLQKATVAGQLWTAWSATRSLLRDIVLRQKEELAALKRIESEEIVLDTKLKDLADDLEKLSGDIRQHAEERNVQRKEQQARSRWPGSAITGQGRAGGRDRSDRAS